ncbi:MAG: hypothetical protein OJI67_16435 [Prosthecobacter sp.]|nr:hypothetical protein [Prosthecobacter sp.]
MRICKSVRQKAILRYTIYPFLILWFLRLGRKFGIRIPLSCNVGDGLLIEHWGGIWVNPSVQIGRNCNIAHAVTLGWSGSETTKGAPIIGDNVFLGPGCAVIGRINIANHALISANSVILQDVPENAVVMGVPGRVFSRSGSHEIIKFCYNG